MVYSFHRLTFLVVYNIDNSNFHRKQHDILYVRSYKHNIWWFTYLKGLKWERTPKDSVPLPLTLNEKRSFLKLLLRTHRNAQTIYQVLINIQYNSEQSASNIKSYLLLIIYVIPTLYIFINTIFMNSCILYNDYFIWKHRFILNFISFFFFG